MALKSGGRGLVVVGGQWGDEGKGRIVDTLSAQSFATVRFQGGNNAGHSLHFDNKSLVLHLIPCGIVRNKQLAIIANGVVIDPEVLLAEMAELKRHNIACSPLNLKISRHAHIILPFHKAIDSQRESEAKNKLGTTKRGIGPCYEYKVARLGLRAEDLLVRSRLVHKLESISQEAMLDQCLAWGDQLGPYLVDSGELIDDLLGQGHQVLFEGAQGALLDIDHGSYPYVTSSNCVAAQAAIGSGIGPGWLKEVLMVSKAYSTRVGEGPFLTELDLASQEIFRKQGNEFGATTGRPRRCGWLDLPALKYAARINGATGLVITKFDILAGLGPIKVATAYRSASGKTISFAEAMINSPETIEIVYQEFEPVAYMPKINHLADMPQSMCQMIELIEKELALPIKMISFGKERGQEIFLSQLTT